MSSLGKAIPIFLASFFFTLHYGVALYINSSFLGSFFSPAFVSILFVSGALLAMSLLSQTPDLIKRYGIKRLFVIFLLLDFASTAGMLTASTKLVVALSFMIFGSIFFGIYYLLDIYLEDITNNKNTGEVRGLYLTLVNLAIATAPLAATLLPIEYGLNEIYGLSLVLLLPVFAVVFLWFKPIKLSRLHENLPLPWAEWRRSPNIFATTKVRFVLEFFYVVMVIYMPIYLHQFMGFTWPQIGVMLSIALLPFVLLEWPAGELADRYWGEKELMTVGLFIMGTTLLVMPFLDKSFLLWTLALFISRIGASLVEVTTETHFFKHVDRRDTGLINIFRQVRPGSLVIGSLIGALLLALNFSYGAIFLFLALVVFWGTHESAHLKDTL